MKTQISRDSFQPDKRYTGIHQQQGRILTDADWNELVAICREQLKQALTDVIGSGTARTGALAITTNRRIQPGDLYVDGRRAELPGTQPFGANAQPDLPGYPVLPNGPCVVYADVWERTVTCLEDAKLRDPGLHGADTCTRTQTMVQIKTCPVTVNPETAIPRHGDATLSLALHTSLEAGDPCDPCAGLIAADQGRVGSYLFRLEVHAVEGAADNPTRLILKWSSENGAEQYQALPVEQMPPGFISDDYVYEFHDLTTEKHLGVFLGTGFTPSHGILRSSYGIPDTAPRDFVRRWDGYCELTRTGTVWSLMEGIDQGVTLTTGGAATAPGHVALSASLQINLGALQLVLDLSGKLFVAGDFWLAPVREAVDGPGSTVLSAAEPKGIEHHYLRLARIQAGGTVVSYDNDAEQRRRHFPPLTDLRAHDVGYESDCDSGLFNTSHDNVEKALNRLCQLAAEHIAYTATCSAGLYAGFSGTVKQALDLICTIQAEHVGFAKPCDTSLYQGQSITTVDDALKLLCDIRAGHIAYQAGGDCTYLNQPGITTVQAALDALCARPVGSGSGGCRITIGEGGRYATLEEALKELLERGERDICLCLLAGDHRITGQVFSPQQQGVNLSLSGCGAATRLYVEQEELVFENFLQVSIADVVIILRDNLQGALAVDKSPELHLNRVAVHGFNSEKYLVGVINAGKVKLNQLFLEAAGTQSLALPAAIFAMQSSLLDLFSAADLNEFNNKVAETARVLVLLPFGPRRLLANAIREQLQGGNYFVSTRELRSYEDLIAQLGKTHIVARELIDVLRRIRIEAIRQNPSPQAALAIEDAAADWTLTNCEIHGTVTFYGHETAEPLPDDVVKILAALANEGAIQFSGNGNTVRCNGCLISRLNVSAAIRHQLANVANQGGGALDQLFSNALFTDTSLVTHHNQAVFVHTSLSSSIFESTQEHVAMFAGASSIYVGNRGAGDTVIMDITPRGYSERVANLGLVISG